MENVTEAGLSEDLTSEQRTNEMRATWTPVKGKGDSGWKEEQVSGSEPRGGFICANNWQHCLVEGAATAAGGKGPLHGSDLPGGEHGWGFSGPRKGWKRGKFQKIASSQELNFPC